MQVSWDRTDGGRHDHNNVLVLAPATYTDTQKLALDSFGRCVDALHARKPV
jgi:hypothetical protein